MNIENEYYDCHPQIGEKIYAGGGGRSPNASA